MGNWIRCSEELLFLLISFIFNLTIYDANNQQSTGLGFAKNPLMIKLERNSLGMYCKRIQLESNFWNENCVYLLVSFCFLFIFISTLMSNGSLHLFVMANALQIDLLILVTSLLPLLHLLLSYINACHEWVTYIWVCQCHMTVLLLFGLINYHVNRVIKGIFVFVFVGFLY